MAFQNRSRAQSTVIGVVILFGFLIIALSLYQVSVVPAENQQIEFSSYTAASTDLTELQSNIVRVADTNSPSVTNIEAGTRYPTRGFFVNPPPAAGQVTTTAPALLTLANASAVNTETGDFWDGTNQTYTYQSVRFSPRYNELSAEPVVANSLITSRDAETRSIPLSSQTLIQNTRISLVVLQGAFDERGMSVGVVADPVSVTQQTVPITANDTTGENVSLTVPTDISPSVWEDEILTSQLQANGGNVVGVTTAGTDAVRIELAGTTASGRLIQYQLQLSLVELRSQSTSSSLSTTETYLTTPDTAPRQITSAETQRLETDVRDAFNNPKSNVPVTFSLSGSGQLSTSTQTGSTVSVNSTADGTATVSYSPSTAGTATITATADLDDNGTVEADEQVDYTVQVSAAGTSSTGTVDVTNGGVSTWQATNDTETLAAPNGRWDNINETGSINISKGEYGYNANLPGQSFELRFSLSNDTTAYQVEVRINSNTQVVQLFGPNGNTPTQTLTDTAVAELLDSDTTAVNILDTQNTNIYSNQDQTFRQLAGEIETLSNGTEAAVLRTGLSRGRAVVRLDAAISGTGGTVQDIQGSATTSGGSGKASFELENTGNTAATITGIAINSTTNPAITEVSAPSNNDAELTSTDQGDLLFATISVGGPQESLDTTQEIQPSEVIEFSFNRFDGDVRNNDVTITLYLSDGSTEQITLSY